MVFSTRLKIFAVIAVIAGPILIFIGWKDKMRLATLEEKGRTVPGFLVGGDYKEGRKSSSYNLDAEYQLEGTPKVQKKHFKVTKTFFKSVSAGNQITKPDVQIRYLPENPDEAIIIGGSDDDVELIWAGLGVGALGLFGCLWFWVLKKG